MSAVDGVAFWDTETNGLLREATKMHSVGIIRVPPDEATSHADQPGYPSIEDGLRLLEEAALRVAHNGDDFDERVTRKLYPWWNPKGDHLDTLLISRLLYPQIKFQGPNSFKVPPRLRQNHSLEAWGYRLGERKDKEFDAGDWQTWSPDMSTYMDQDVVVLRKLFGYLMKQKPSPVAVEVEHKFAAIMRRQEAWGFTFDHDAALVLEAELASEAQALEADLIEDFGDIWMGGKVTTPRVARLVKCPEFPDVTLPRFGKTGKPLKPYVGPPLCEYRPDAPYTPVKLVQFQPSSPIQVEIMLRQRHGWKPTAYTKPTKTHPKGQVKMDDEVLRSLPYPETPKLADLYQITKIWGYVAKGTGAWLKTCEQDPEDGAWRQHGRVLTIGTYTFRCSHSKPNMAQVPSRSPKYGHRCRSLFKAREGFVIVGFDGSSMQLRLMAHHMARFDGGKYAGVFERGEDPHEFMRDAIGTDLMGEGDEGRKKGKTIDYALPFGGGEKRLGGIIQPLATDKRKVEIGKIVKARLLPTFGEGFEELQKAIKGQVEGAGYLVGLDGRRAYVNQAHIGLSTLLQMGEAIVMRHALVILDERLKEMGFRCGVDDTGLAHPSLADYEFCANVHDEAQADVRPEIVAAYSEVASWCVAEAGRRLGLKCPLASDVKVGQTWQETH